MIMFDESGSWIMKLKEYHNEKKSRAVDVQPMPRIQDRLGPWKTNVPQYEYMPLQTPRSKILQQTEFLGILKPPTKVLFPLEKWNQTKYCQFHKDHGHDTENRNELKKEIENAIWRGQLK